jgi:hypothetical protein
MGRRELLRDPIQHVDKKAFDSTPIVDMDFFQALGFRHYRGTPTVDDKKLRELYIDRIYGTYIDEEQPVMSITGVSGKADPTDAGARSTSRCLQESLNERDDGL